MNGSVVTEELALEECWALLERHTVGRLAVDIAGRPDIFPVNYVVDCDTIVFRSGAGTKLAGAVLNRHVALEIDGYAPDERVTWSVVVKGSARELESMSDRYPGGEPAPAFRGWLRTSRTSSASTRTS